MGSKVLLYAASPKQLMLNFLNLHEILLCETVKYCVVAGLLQRERLRKLQIMRKWSLKMAKGRKNVSGDYCTLNYFKGNPSPAQAKDPRITGPADESRPVHQGLSEPLAIHTAREDKGLPV